MIFSQKSLFLVSFAACSTLVAAAGDDPARPRGVGPECEYHLRAWCTLASHNWSCEASMVDNNNLKEVLD